MPKKYTLKKQCEIPTSPTGPGGEGGAVIEQAGGRPTVVGRYSLLRYRNCGNIDNGVWEGSMVWLTLYFDRKKTKAGNMTLHGASDPAGTTGSVSAAVAPYDIYIKREFLRKMVSPTLSTLTIY